MDFRGSAFNGVQGLEACLDRPWPYLLLVAPFIGSTLGVLIRRLPTAKPVFWSRSECETCGHRLSPLELIPILSYLALRGRCRACGAPIGLSSLAVELSACAIALAAALCASDPVVAWGSATLGWMLLALAWIDAEHMILPDLLTLPLLLLGLAWAALEAPETLTDRVLGAAIGYTLFRAIALTYRRLRGIEGLGEGDAKLLAACSAWLGATMLAPLLLLSAFAGLALALSLRLRGELSGRNARLPFGPCLALSAWLLRLWWSR